MTTLPTLSKADARAIESARAFLADGNRASAGNVAGAALRSSRAAEKVRAHVLALGLTICPRGLIVS